MGFDPQTILAVAACLAVTLMPGLAVVRVAEWLSAARVAPDGQGSGRDRGGGRGQPCAGQADPPGLSDPLGLGDPAVAWGLAAAVGVALQPVSLLWLSAAGLGVGAWWPWLLVVLATVVLGVRLRTRPSTEGRARLGRQGASRAGASRAGAARTFHPAHLVLIATVVVTLASRWVAAAPVEVPLWGDSVHHTMIVDLMLQEGGLPTDWRPYAELATFSYHFGFHALAASVSWMAGLAPHASVVVTGQILQVLGVLTAYALAAWLGRSAWAGALAAIVVAGLSPMPAYYLNWGRYTQLAGQVILPGAALAAAALGTVGLNRPWTKLRPGRGWVWLAVAGVLVAGLALSHYVVTAFLAAFGIAWLVVGRRLRLRPLTGLIAAAVAGFLVALPWLPRFLAGPLGGYAVRLTTSPDVNPAVFGVGTPGWVWDEFSRLAGWSLGVAILAGVGVSAVAALMLRGVRAPSRSGRPRSEADAAPRTASVDHRRPRAAAEHGSPAEHGSAARAGLVGGVWVALLLALSHPWAFGLPTVGVIKDFTVMVGLYAPGSLAVAGLAALPALWARRLAPSLARSAAPSSATGSPLGSAWAGRADWALAAVLAVAAVVLVWPHARVLDPSTSLVTSNDLEAFEWISAHTAEDARFLVSSFEAFGDTVQAGDDAGWWLPYFTGRASTLAPITVGLERPFEPGYRESLNELSTLWHEDLDARTTQAALDAMGVTHAFSGEVSQSGAEEGGGPTLADRLTASDHWRQVHTVGDAAVWERTDS